MPTAFDVFKKTHTRKNEQGEHVYVCKKAEEVADEYHQEIETEQSQCNNNQEGGDENSSQAPKVDPNEVFYKTVKGKSKKRQKIYGPGPCASQYYSNSVSEIGTSSKTSTYDEVAIEKIKEEYAIKLQTEVETLKKTLEDSMQQKFQQMYMLGPPPPWAYPPPSQGATGYWSGPPTGMGAAGSSSGPPGGPWWGGPSSAGAAGGSSGPPVGPWWGGPPSGAGATGGSSSPPASSWWSGPPGWWSTSTPAPKDTNVDASTDVGVDVGTDIDVDTNVDP